MPSGPVLSETDKDELRKKLKELCEQCWTVSGYKKTNIKELCAKTEIAVGTFYALYPTKEDLFLETIESIQKRLTKKFLNTCKKNPSKEGFAQSMKEMFREYETKPFLYDINQSFVKKLSNEAMEKLKFDTIELFREAARISNLKIKTDEYEACGVFSALLSTIYAKESLSVTCNYLAVFDFMVDSLIPNIFE